MQENHNIPVTDFQRLQQSLERVVNKIGVQRTTELLESFDNNSSTTSNELGKVKLITTYVISQSILLFDLDESQFYTSDIREYREARMACYHIIHKFNHIFFCHSLGIFSLLSTFLYIFSHFLSPNNTLLA